MKKLLKFHDTYTLKILVCLLLLFTVLYPKLPSIHIMRTWVYIRLEDFLILATVVIWAVQVLRKKVTLPIPFVASIGTYWLVGLVSVIVSIALIGPMLSNYFPHLVVLSYFRRIEYMILFFCCFLNNQKRQRCSYLFHLPFLSRFWCFPVRDGTAVLSLHVGSLAQILCSISILFSIIPDWERRVCKGPSSLSAKRSENYVHLWRPL